MKDELINITAKRDPVSGGLGVCFDAPELPERVIVGTYIPPFDTGVYIRVRKAMWSDENGYTCGCGARVRGFKRRCHKCGAWLDYDGVGPKEVLD